MGVEIADDETAAVEIDERGQRLGRGVDGRVAAVGQGAGGPGQFAVLDAADRHVLGVGRLRERRYALAGLGRGHLPDLRPAGGDQNIEQILRVRIERHERHSRLNRIQLTPWRCSTSRTASISLSSETANWAGRLSRHS